ncbi:tetratricopeptide repeat protein [Desulfosoma sp.]
MKIGRYLLWVLVVCAPFVLGPQASHADELEALNEKVTQLYEQGRYEEAMDCAEKALNVAKSHHGEKHPRTATCYNDIGVLYRVTGRYGEAEAMHKKALEIRRKTLGEDHGDTAQSYNNLAALYQLTGRYGKAEPLHKKALKIFRKTYGENHPSTATSISNIAELYQTTGRYGEAEPLYQKALKIFRKAHGENHRSTATTRENLAGFYLTIGRYGEAEALYKRALEIARKTHGEDHPDTARSYGNIALVYEAMGRYGEAEALYKRALEIARKTHGEDHPDTATYDINLAFFYLAQGEISRAEEIFHSRKHETGLSLCALKRRDYQKALGGLESHLIINKLLGNTKQVISALIGVGLAREGLGDIKGARKAFEEAVGLIEPGRKSLSREAQKSFVRARTALGFSRLDAYAGLIRVLEREGTEEAARKAREICQRIKATFSPKDNTPWVISDKTLLLTSIPREGKAVAFVQEGAAALSVSLWNVDDEATYRLMNPFTPLGWGNT